MQVVAEMSKYQLVPIGPWEMDPIATSQTDVQLGDTMSAWTAPFGGQVVAISASLATAATLGTLTIGPTVNGTEKSALTMSVTTGTAPYATCLRDTVTFAAGDSLGVEVTTSATYNGTGLRVVVWCVFTVTGI